MKLRSMVGVLGWGLIGLLQVSAAGTPPVSREIPGQFIVKFKANSSGAFSGIQAGVEMVSEMGDQAIQGIKVFQANPQWARVTMAPTLEGSLAALTLQDSDLIESIEPDVYLEMDSLVGPAIPNDEKFGELYALKNTGQTDAEGTEGIAGADIRVMPVWAAGFRGSRSVIVGVVDTGVDSAHPDLAANIYTNPLEAANPTDGIDNDGNGYIDDVHGWNFEANTKDSSDGYGHGSHCSGTIGAVGGNSVGVVGVNWEVSVLPLRVADDEGSFSLSGAVESIQYAVKMKAHVISGSWGSYIDSPALKEAIHQAQVAGVLYVASAGNSTSDLDAKPRFPASYGLEYDNMIVVAATDNRDELTDYSSYGLKTAQLAAPGTNILSTVPGGKYDHYSGTSMSTPHVAGAAALLMSAHPEWTYADVKKHLVESVDKLSTLEGKVSSGGRLNVRKALGL